MPRHLVAKVHVSLFFFSLKYVIRALLSTSNIDSFALKLFDSENSRMAKAHGFLIVRHFVSLLGVVFTELTSFCSVGNLYYWCCGCRLF